MGPAVRTRTVYQGSFHVYDVVAAWAEDGSTHRRGAARAVFTHTVPAQPVRRASGRSAGTAKTNGYVRGLTKTWRWPSASSRRLGRAPCMAASIAAEGVVGSGQGCPMMLVVSSGTTM